LRKNDIYAFGQIPTWIFQGDSRCGFDQELELLLDPSYLAVLLHRQPPSIGGALLVHRRQRFDDWRRFTF
jgi:hypothetical protein